MSTKDFNELISNIKQKYYLNTLNKHITPEISTNENLYSEMHNLRDKLTTSIQVHQ